MYTQQLITAITGTFIAISIVETIKYGIWRIAIVAKRQKIEKEIDEMAEMITKILRDNGNTPNVH